MPLVRSRTDAGTIRPRSTLLVYHLRQVNVVNIGGDKEIGRFVCRSMFLCVYTMTHRHLRMSYTTGRNGGALL